MIILKDVPFERQARFLHDNICAYPGNPAFEQAAGGMAEGLRAYLDLLRAIYSDLSAIEGKADKDKYANLIATVDFLYAIFAFGSLSSGLAGAYVQIDKETLSQAYRKGSLTRRIRHLEHHGFCGQYLADGVPCASLSQASHISLAYGRHPGLVPALKHFAESTASMHTDRNPIYNQVATFLKADYEAAMMGKPIPRDSLDPLRDDILRTVDTYQQAWVDLVGSLVGQCGLACSGFWHYGASPSWSISFSEGRKKPLAIFTVGSNIIFIEFTLPVEAAEQIILTRHTYSDTIREAIESFHCVKCPKDCNGANLTKVDGIWLCKGRAEARRIYTTLKLPEDFKSVRSMLDMIC